MFLGERYSQFLTCRSQRACHPNKSTAARFNGRGGHSEDKKKSKPDSEIQSCTS
jgi:hypothetical protein